MIKESGESRSLPTTSLSETSRMPFSYGLWRSSRQNRPGVMLGRLVRRLVLLLSVVRKVLDLRLRL